jgi:hypothetical protein
VGEVKLLERGTNNVSSRRLGIASFTQQVNEAVDPVGVAELEASGFNPMPTAEIGRLGSAGLA